MLWAPGAGLRARAGGPGSYREGGSDKLLARTGLANKLHFLPNELSARVLHSLTHWDLMMVFYITDLASWLFTVSCYTVWYIHR